MQIGQVAKMAGLSPGAIRFYERSALLPPPPRTLGGYRRYSCRDVEMLAFIRRVQNLGFTLGEIRELLGLLDSHRLPCAPVRARLKEKLAHVRRQIADLHKLEHTLDLALRRCDRELKHGGAQCPVLRDAAPGLLRAAQ
ncbi:MAG: heavy metal-responsive transcriptional regulator [Terriglobales bacterium]